MLLDSDAEDFFTLHEVCVFRFIRLQQMCTEDPVFCGKTVEHVNRPGLQPDVTVLIVSRGTGVKVANQISKETDVTCALRDSREMVARNVPLVSKEINVKIVQRDSKEINVISASSGYYGYACSK